MGGFHGQRAVYIDLEAVMAGHKPFFLNMAYQIQQLLGTSHCKGRYDHVSLPVQGLLNDSGQTVHMVYILFMAAVSVGRFHHHVICLCNILWITDQGLILISNVAGKYDFFLAGTLSGPYLYGSRPQ